jgi:two-component system KDP operon response regulator KdpE
MTIAVDKSRVLVVGDEPAVANPLRHVLSIEGYHVRTAAGVTEALVSLSEWRPALVVTDLRLAPMNGLELCLRIRAGSNVPIIVVSGDNGSRSRVEALDSGADDYLVRPFDTDELLARVRAVLRRGMSTTPESAGSLEAGDFRIDLDARRVHIRASEVRLTPKEFEMFLYLARRPNRVIPSARLLSAVWGVVGSDYRHYLHVLIRQLRQKLEENPSRPRYLVTEPWVGYRFNASTLIENGAA